MSIVSNIIVGLAVGTLMGCLYYKFNYERADQITKAALARLPIKNLYEQAAMVPGYQGELGNYKIKFVKKTRTGFEADCCPDSRTIELLNTVSDEKALTYFIFELINAKTYSEHIQLYNKFWDSKNSAEYAKESERLEYINTIEHYNIIKSAGLGPSYVVWGERTPEEFEEVWENQLETSSHADYWRSQGKSLGKLTGTMV